MIMATKKNVESLDKMTYQQLEEESSKVLESLNRDDIPLDEAAKLFEYGKKVYAEMEKRLSQLEKDVTDTVNRG
jgi:exodeoxyribonuclease VII small subunit